MPSEPELTPPLLRPEDIAQIGDHSEGAPNPDDGLTGTDQPLSNHTVAEEGYLTQRM